MRKVKLMADVPPALHEKLERLIEQRKRLEGQLADIRSRCRVIREEMDQQQRTEFSLCPGVRVGVEDAVGEMQWGDGRVTAVHSNGRVRVRTSHVDDGMVYRVKDGSGLTTWTALYKDDIPAVQALAEEALGR